MALFYVAFLPQFVDPARGHVTLQILQLGVLFALMGWCSDSVYAVIAGTVAERIRGSLRVKWITRADFSQQPEQAVPDPGDRPGQATLQRACQRHPLSGSV